MAHGQEREHQLPRVGLGEPGHIVIDGALDRIARVVQLFAQAVFLAESEQSLFGDQVVEIFLQLRSFARSADDIFGVLIADRSLDNVEALSAPSLGTA